MIPLPSSPLLVLPLQQKILQHAAPEQKNRQISQHDTVTTPIVWGVPGLVDVRRHDPVEIARADYDAQGDATLVDALGIVCGPDDCVADARVDAKGAEESAGVADAGRCAGHEHREAGHAEERDADVVHTSSMCPVGDFLKVLAHVDLIEGLLYSTYGPL